MKALCIWFGLLVCISSGERGVIAVSLFPLKNDNGNQVVNAKSSLSKDTLNLFSNAVDKNYAVNEVLRNNGIQNNLVYHRRSLNDNNINQNVENVNGLTYRNSNESSPLNQRSFKSSLFPYSSKMSGLFGQGGHYWVKENKQNSNLNYWIPSRQSHIGILHSHSSAANIKNVNSNLDFPNNKVVNPSFDLPEDVYYQQFSRHNKFVNPSLDFPDDMYYPHFSPGNKLVNPNLDVSDYVLHPHFSPNNKLVNPNVDFPDDNNMYYPHVLPNNKDVDLILDFPDTMYYPNSLPNNNLVNSKFDLDDITFKPLQPDENSNLPNTGSWNPWNQNDFECEKYADIINDIRVLVRKQDILEERYSLKLLFRILGSFIYQNNLQYLPFRVAVKEIELVLLKEDHADLRNYEIEDVVQEFRKNELHEFFSEIQSGRQQNLKIAVSKLALLLYNFRNSLIQRGFYQRDIKLVITRLVQLSVPLVSYYFERECKIKTQKYILQNLEIALNVNFEDVKHVGSIRELEAEGNLGVVSNFFPEGLDNFEDLNSVRNLAVGRDLRGLENLENPIGLEALQNPRLGKHENSGFITPDMELYFRQSGKPEESQNVEAADTQAA